MTQFHNQESHLDYTEARNAPQRNGNYGDDKIFGLPDRRHIQLFEAGYDHTKPDTPKLQY